MDCERYSTTKGRMRLYRRTRLCLLVVGLVKWTMPVAAQEEPSSPCSNGVVVANPQDHPGLVGDCEVLLAVHEQLEGDLLFYIDWSADLSISEWYGVTVSDSRVRELNLSGEYSISKEWEDGVVVHVETLSGPIPPEVGRLTNLTSLDLSTNQFTGQIPPELTQLTNLTNLNLSVNSLTGPIPTELGQLTKLTDLDLEWNDFTGPIPTELSRLTNLINLNFRFNNLTGPISLELIQLKKLRSLVLSSNDLTGGIPPELAQLTNLEYLLLRDNELLGSIPPELGGLTNLISLDLSFNDFTGPIPPELAQLTNLTYLRLDANELTGAVPTELGQLPELERLYLAGNQLTCIPETLEWASDLPVCDATAVESSAVPRPVASRLAPNFPNPFNSVTQIAYRLATPGRVRLVIYNATGQPVQTLVDQVQTAGWYLVPWDARDQQGVAVSAGVYLTCLHYPGGVQTRRLLHLK